MRVVYAGSFDPVTNGHLWMIEYGWRMWKKQFLVAIGINPDKRPMFSLDERVAMIKDAVWEKMHADIPVEVFENQYLVNYAKSLGPDTVILRGLRSADDFRQEFVMRQVNADIDGTIDIAYAIPPRGLIEVSSSMVKGLVGPKGWEDVVKKYVPGGVLKKLSRET